jgi:hypothetical protein
MGLFKRKPGGTLVGNLIRGAVKAIPVVGGYLGNGGMMISQQDADKRDMSDSEYRAKYGVEKDGRPVSVVPQIAQQVGAVLGAGVTGLQNLAPGPLPYTTTNIGSNVQTGADLGVAGTIKKFGGWIAGGVLAIVLLIVLLKKKK